MRNRIRHCDPMCTLKRPLWNSENVRCILVFKRYRSDKHLSDFLPTRWRQKSTGTVMERNDYVTVTLSWQSYEAHLVLQVDWFCLPKTRWLLTPTLPVTTGGRRNMMLLLTRCFGTPSTAICSTLPLPSSSSATTYVCTIMHDNAFSDVA